MSKVDELARVAYAAYGKTTDYKNFQGNPMPAYDDLGASIQNAWENTAVTVYERACRDMANRIVQVANETLDPA